MDIVNFDALKAQDKIINPIDVDPNEDYFILGKKNVHYNTNSMKATNYPVWAIKAKDVLNPTTPPYVPAYKVYSAIVTQVGTNDPVVVAELENTLGAPVAWYRQAQGTYYAESFGSFTAGKTVIIVGTSYTGDYSASVFRDHDTYPDQVFIDTVNTSGVDDSLLNNRFIEIRVYN
jgi:hypothetical protein